MKIKNEPDAPATGNSVKETRIFGLIIFVYFIYYSLVKNTYPVPVLILILLSGLQPFIKIKFF